MRTNHANYDNNTVYTMFDGLTSDDIDNLVKSWKDDLTNAKWTIKNLQHIFSKKHGLTSEQTESLQQAMDELYVSFTGNTQQNPGE